MRNLFLSLIPALLLSCGNNAERDAMHLMDSVNEADSLYAAVKFAKSERLEKLRDSLVSAGFFLVEGGDCVSTRLEETKVKNKNAFSITVLAYDGQLNYVSKVSDNKNSAATHDRLRFSTPGDTVWLFDEVSSISRLQNQLDGKEYEEVTFADFNDISVADFIMKHQSDEITVTPMTGEYEATSYILLEQDKKAVAECAMLSNVFKEMSGVYSY